jgi:hypothetical protein
VDLKLQAVENKRESMLVKCLYGFIIFDNQATFFTVMPDGYVSGITKCVGAVHIVF